MDQIFTQMFSMQPYIQDTDKEIAATQILKEIVLCGLSRAGIFRSAALYGDTALKMFYDSERSSEILEFKPSAAGQPVRFEDYYEILQKEISSYGFWMGVEDPGDRKKGSSSPDKEETILVFEEDRCTFGVPGLGRIRLLLKAEQNPAEYAGYEHRYRLLPAPYEICLYDGPSLLAEIIYSLLDHSIRRTLSGKYLYDYTLCLGKNIPVNLRHLRRLLIRSGQISAGERFKEQDLKSMLCEMFRRINFERVRREVLPFVRDPRPVELWSRDFFEHITEALISYDLFVS